MAALRAGDESALPVSPSHVVQVALAALKSQLRGVGPVALRDMDAFCIKGLERTRSWPRAPGRARCGPTDRLRQSGSIVRPNSRQAPECPDPQDPFEPLAELAAAASMDVVYEGRTCAVSSHRRFASGRRAGAAEQYVYECLEVIGPPRSGLPWTARFSLSRIRGS
jgi:hypothetical protein